MLSNNSGHPERELRVPWIYGFQRQLLIGATGEAMLDRTFSKDFLITPATDEEQRRGIDRHFEHRRTHQRMMVEYKTDHRAAFTQNAFIETVSQDTWNIAGWAYTAEADHRAYYVPKGSHQKGSVFLLHMSELRLQLARWTECYPSTSVANDGYRTHGLLVPLRELRTSAISVLSVEPEAAPRIRQ